MQEAESLSSGVNCVGVCETTASQPKQLPADQSHERVRGYFAVGELYPNVLLFTSKNVMRAAEAIVHIVLFCIGVGNPVFPSIRCKNLQKQKQ